LFDQRIRGRYDRSRAAKAAFQHMVARTRVPGREILNAPWSGEPEGVDALVVVSGGEDPYSVCGDQIHEPNVERIQVLVLIDNEKCHVGDFSEAKVSRLNLLHAEPDDFSRQDGGVGLSRDLVMGNKRPALALTYWRTWLNIAGRHRRACAPERLMRSANVLAPTFGLS
jgi:hypothetical protein